jgi:dUTP pyrophosphatase
MQLRFKLAPNGIAPTRSYESPGIDLYAAEEEWLAPGRVIRVSLGVRFEIPLGYVGVLKDRSSSARNGFFAVAGVIDPDYRGIVLAQLVGIGCGEVQISKGQKIIQMLIVATPLCELVETDDFSVSRRGEQGFGSSGV